MKVDLGDEQYFVNPAGSVWVGKLDRSSFHVLGDATATSKDHFQVARARVGGRTLLLVLPLERPTSPDERSRIASLIAEHIGDEAVAFVTELAEGRASLDVAANLAREAAAAIAVLRATWAWDESPDFEIQVNGVRYGVVVEREHGAWHAPVIFLLDQIEHIRRRPEMYMGHGVITGPKLQARLADDAAVLGCVAECCTVGGWSVVASASDWLVLGAHVAAIQTLFDQFVPLPERGYSMRSEFLVRAFASRCLTLTHEERHVIAGSIPHDDPIWAALERPEWARVVAFELADPS